MDLYTSDGFAVPLFAQQPQDLRQQALALAREGKHEQALTCLLKAVRRHPNCADTHNNLGVVLGNLGNHIDALDHFDIALRLCSDHVLAHRNKGNALRLLGRSADAVACFEHALRLQPDDSDSHNSLGLTWRDLGEHARAIDSFRAAVRFRPDHCDALNNLGVILADQGQLGEAVKVYCRCLRHHPDAAEIHNNLGVALADQGNHPTAIAAYEHALQLQPDYAQAHNNLGNALRELGQLDRAALSLQQAIRLAPNYPEAHNNLGIVRLKQGRFDEALAGYQQAIALRPDYAEAHLNRALWRLQAGDFPQGWPEYDWRFRMKAHGLAPLPQPCWNGGPLEGQVLLLRHEQGLGDTLQFVRYGRVLQQRGARVILEVPPGLVPLLRHCAGIDQVVPQGQPLPPFDAYIPLLCAPGLLGSTLPAVPNSVPYLPVDPALLHKWRQRLQAVPGFKIGIAWQGSKRYKDDRYRSIALKHFEPLARLPGVKLVSLQKGDGSDQLRKVQEDWAVIDLGTEADQQGAFTDTAAVMKCLDLVVCSDTALADLAGGLGVAVSLALPLAADWRWLRQREDCPWYPTMRLFRQRRWGDWPEVFARIADEVRSRQLLSNGGPVRQPDPGDVERLCRQGVAWCEQGRWDEAIRCNQEAVRLAPDSALAHHNLGYALEKQKRLDEAIAAYQQALRLQPGYASAWHNLGEAWQQQGKLAGAIGCYEEALRLDATMPKTHNNLATALLQLGRLEEARQHGERAIALAPHDGQAHYNLGNVLEKLRRLDEAAIHHEQALAALALPVPALLNLGQECATQGKLSEAAAAFRLALHLEPANVAAAAQLGFASMQQERWPQSIGALEKAVRLQPQDGNLLHNLGNALRRAGRFADAEAVYREVLRRHPNAGDAYNHLGMTLLEQQRPSEAQVWFDRGRAVDPTNSHLHNNLGVALEQQGKLHEACLAYQETLRYQPDAAETHRNLALGKLLLGDFEEGWPEYEWRWKCPGAINRNFTQPPWDGGPLQGKTILLHHEQGYGDSLMFVRYAPLVVQRGGRVVLEVPGNLVPLLSRCAGIDRLVAQGTPLPHFDVHTPLLSLPGLFGTTLETVPNSVPYLAVEPERIEKWRRHLCAIEGFKIAIAWQGSRAYQGDRHRSIALKHFEPLARLPGVKLVSLQKGFGTEQLQQVQDWAVIDLDKDLDQDGAFLDSAAVMQCVDLVVCSDTALVHLAGGLGVPVCLALPMARDWRWLLDRADSPWYPSLRLFRQRHWGDWTDVFARITDEVQQRAASAALRQTLMMEDEEQAPQECPWAESA